MDSVFLLAVVSSVVSSIGGLAGGVFLMVRERLAHSLSRLLIGFSAGVLLGVTFIDLLPEALSGFDDARTAFTYVLIGVLVFFMIERIIASLHTHEHVAEVDESDVDAVALRRSVPLVMFGDAVHNFIDGVTVAAAFVVSVPLGIATAASVLLHELPHEIADFTILLRSGMARRSVFLFNLYSALVAPIGTVIAYYFASGIESFRAPLVAIAAGNLLYISMSDLLPHLHHEKNRSRAFLQVAMLIVGALLMLLFPFA